MTETTTAAPRISLRWILILVAVILIALAAFGVGIEHVNLFFLGLAFFFASMLV